MSYPISQDFRNNLINPGHQFNWSEIFYFHRCWSFKNESNESSIQTMLKRAMSMDILKDLHDISLNKLSAWLEKGYKEAIRAPSLIPTHRRNSPEHFLLIKLTIQAYCIFNINKRKMEIIKQRSMNSKFSKKILVELYDILIDLCRIYNYFPIHKRSIVL